MPRFLIDVNLPYRFSLWHSPDYVHMHDLGDRCRIIRMYADRVEGVGDDMP